MSESQKRPHRSISINQKMLAALFIFIILPLVLAGALLIGVVSRQDLITACDGYQTRLRWISNQIDTVMLDSENIALSLYLDKAAQTFLKSKNKNMALSYDVSTLMNEQARNKDWYQSICISVDEQVFIQWRGGTILDRDEIESLQKARSLSRHGFWSMPRRLTHITDPQRAFRDPVLTFYGKIYDYNRFENILGVVSISISEAYIAESYSAVLSADKAINMLIYDDGSVMSANDKTLLGEHYDYYSLIHEQMSGDVGYFPLQIGPTQNLVFYFSSEHYDWRLISIVPVDSLTDGHKLTLSIVAIAVFLCILFGICFCIIQQITIINPLTRLAGMMRKVPEDRIVFTPDDFAPDEIGMLYLTFRQMNTDLNDMIEKIYVSEIYRKEAELQMLISQINPHFLYNTLDSIQWLANKNKDYIVADQITALSGLFRYVLQKDQKLTCLFAEVELLEKYIRIMEIQRSDPIELIVDIDEDLLSKRIPRLLLQPLVENALLHGFKRKRDGGCIVLAAETAAQKLRISISDNGMGTNEETVRNEMARSETGHNAFALKNVKKRIQLMFGEPYDLEFYSTVGEGTTVVIILPEEPPG